MLRRALAIDPTYAPAAAMLGTVPDPPESRTASESFRIRRSPRRCGWRGGAIEAGKDDPDALWMAGWTLLDFRR